MSEWKETEIGKIPVSWKTIEIGNLLMDKGISVGVMYPGEYTEDGVPLVRAGDIKNGKIDKTIQYRISKSTNELHKRTILNGDELLVVLVGQPGVGVVVDEYFNGWNVARAVGVLRFIDKSERQFVSYSLKHTGVKSLLLASCNTTVQPTLNLAELKEVIIPWPSKKIRFSIASVLSSLDDKIDLLHRQNATLEKMAETLFRQWFVEEAKEEWEIKPLGSLVAVKRGGSPRPIQDYLSDTGLRWLKISDATKENSPYIFDIKEYIKIEGLNKTTHLKAGTLVLSNSATPGIPKILQVDTCIHDGWLHFPKSHFSNEFLYLLFKKIRPELLQQGNGSIFTNLKTDILKEYPIPIADNESLLFFDKQVKPIFNKILKNQTQIRTLTALRDTLLPKLMSGEVRVTTANDQ